ncbi:MAG: (2Fe-2S)-binding protein [Nitrososphaerota archaeon]|jgi:bidirectional [NiFe] hydrogenase diaphorase subunit|nr:(2Fe-2S)-binding protein [Nitrososphaerota archaeon]
MAENFMITLKIDGVQISVPEGTTILKAAKDNGILIPTLCDLEGLTPYGGCRLCLVEVTGSPKLFTACTTPANPGMDVTTNSERLKNYRKIAVQMLMSERVHMCAVCVANDHCELQALANQLGVNHVAFERHFTREPIDSSHDFLVIDRNRCILCTRCVRVCDKIEGVHTLDLKKRSKNTEVIMDLDEAWGDSCSCTGCRKCAKVCPVGAIYIEGEAMSQTKNPDVAEFITARRNRK